MALEIYSREKQGLVILDIRGCLDINASEFIEVVGWHIANRRIDILCDFKAVEMIDYAGLSVVTIAYKNVINHNGRMKFFNVPVCVRNILRAVMLEEILDIYDTEELALNAFKEDREIQKIQHINLRRRFKRVALEIAVAYKAKYGDQKEYKGSIIDISGEGAFIFGKKTFALHDILELEFDLGSEGKIKTQVKLVWLADKELQPHQYPGMGVEFHEILASDQKKLVSFVEKNADARSAEHLPPL
jgi:anti-anti-sigma factor